MLWAMVNMGMPSRARKILVVMTGEEMDDATGLGFIGTVQVPPFVFHVFEVGGH